jgi:plasmid replication initiation protein
MKIKKNAPNLKSVVAKDNQIIGYMSKFELSELRLIAFCLAHYDSRKPDNCKFEAAVKEMVEIFPMDKNSAYAVVRKAIAGIAKKPLEIETETTAELWHWFAGFRYLKYEGYFEFVLTKEAMPYLLDLSKSFTRYRLQDVYQFRSANTWKLYELLKRWLKKRSWEVDLDELRELLGITGKYQQWAALDRAMLRPAAAEINRVSDIHVTYTKIKRVRTVIGLRFAIRPASPSNADTVDIESDWEQLYLDLREIGVNRKTAKKYADEVDLAGMAARILKKLPVMIKRARPAERQRYVLGAIKNELKQLSLPEQGQLVPDHQQAMNCWNQKRQAKAECKVRQRGTAGNRKKCQVCLEKIPVEMWGV